MAVRTAKISDPVGLHLRAASRIVQVAKRYDSEIRIAYGGVETNAKSILGLMMLAAWLTKEGLVAEDAYHARRVAKKPAIPRKIFGSVLTGIGLAIANSPLVKTAIAGEDPNWGRIVMAVGKSGAAADRDRLTIQFGDVLVAENGWVAPSYREEDAAALMKEPEIVISVDLGLGAGNAPDPHLVELTDHVRRATVDVQRMLDD